MKWLIFTLLSELIMCSNLCLHERPSLLFLLASGHVLVVLFGLWEGREESVEDPKEPIGLQVGQLFSKVSQRLSKLQQETRWVKLLSGHLDQSRPHIQSMLYVQRVQILFHHVAPPRFYSSPERTKQTLVLERAFHVLSGHNLPQSYTLHF